MDPLRAGPDHVPRGHPRATTSSWHSPWSSTCTLSSASSRSPSYGEGWGLYAERLADEMGLYATPLQRLGMLTLDSLRASRLVVDTGIHAKGWTRQRAIDFLYDHTALVRGIVEAEVDRYIADPGQAASYMIGRLEIDRLRADAAGRLGDRFSVRAFHDTILHGGMTPLDELARRIDAWIDATPRRERADHVVDVRRR